MHLGLQKRNTNQITQHVIEQLQLPKQNYTRMSQNQLWQSRQQSSSISSPKTFYDDLFLTNYDKFYYAVGLVTGMLPGLQKSPFSIQACP